MSIVSPMNGRAVGGTATINIDIRFWKCPLPAAGPARGTLGAALTRQAAKERNQLRAFKLARSSGARPGAEMLHDLLG